MPVIPFRRREQAPREVGVCCHCAGPVVFRRGETEARCRCGRTVIPASFLRPVAKPATMGRWA